MGFAVTAIKKADKVDATLKISHAGKKYSADATLDHVGKVALSASLAEVAPGLKLSGSVALPDASSAKLAVDYVFPYLTLKSTVALTSAPLIDLAAATSYKGFLIGGETAYDTAKSAVTKYNLALGYHAADYQVAAFLVDKAATAKLAYSHTINSSTTVGAEIVRKVASGDTTFTLGYAKKLSSGALAKIKVRGRAQALHRAIMGTRLHARGWEATGSSLKDSPMPFPMQVDNSGTVSTLYETKLASGEKVAGSLQLQATDLAKPVKYGFSLDLA